jgi:hypothetical protein
MEETMTEESYPPNRRKLPDRRQDEYHALNTKIDERFEALTNRFARFITKALMAFTVIGLTSAIALLGFGLVLRREGRNTDDIQKQRRESILIACRDQNIRHDNTVIQFRRIAATATANNPKQAKQIRRNIEANLKIIDAIAPKQDCDRLVQAAVKGG